MATQLEDLEDDDLALESIADKVRQGYTSGYSPKWLLRLSGVA